MPFVLRVMDDGVVVLPGMDEGSSPPPNLAALQVLKSAKSRQSGQMPGKNADQHPNWILQSPICSLEAISVQDQLSPKLIRRKKLRPGVRRCSSRNIRGAVWRSQQQFEFAD